MFLILKKERAKETSDLLPLYAPNFKLKFRCAILPASQSVHLKERFFLRRYYGI
jgi:hypothetical protein